MLKKKVKFSIFVFFLACFFSVGLFLVNAQRIPEIARQQASEQDILEIYCLMTKWKTGEFFSVLEALNNILIPALNNMKEMGIKVEIPDIASYQAKAQEKLDVVCNAKTYNEVEKAMDDLMAFSETAKQELGKLNGSMAASLKTKGEEMKLKVQKETDSIVREEKSKIEQEIQEEANKLASQMTSQLENEMTSKGFKSKEEADAYAQTRANQIKSSIEAQLNALAEEKKQAIIKKINNKVSEMLGGDAEKFKSIGSEISGIEAEINKYIAERKKDYEIYRERAMAKRKELILAAVNKNIENAIAKIKEKASLLEEAKLNDSTIKSADDYIAGLEADKNILVEKIQAAVEAGNEAGMISAIEEMKTKWDELRLKLETDLAKRKTARAVCSLAREQIGQAKTQLEKGISQIDSAISEIKLKSTKCEIYSEEVACQKVSQLLVKLTGIKNRAQNILDKINQAEQKCASVSEEAGAVAVAENLFSIKNLGQGFREEISALKNSWPEIKKEIENNIKEINK